MGNNHSDIKRLHDDIKSNNNNSALQVIQDLIDKQKIDELNWQDKDGETALMKACVTGNSFITTELLRYTDAKGVNTKAQHGKTALYYACENGNSDTRIDIISALLEIPGIDINGLDFEATPLAISCKNGHLDAVAKLMSCDDINVNSPSHCGYAPLFYAFGFYGESSIEIISLLLSKPGTDVNYTNELRDNDRFPLYTVCQTPCEENLKRLRLLLDYEGLDVNLQTNTGGSALERAMSWNNVDVVKLLLARDDIDVNLPINYALRTFGKDSDVYVYQGLLHGLSPLHRAVTSRHTEILKLLLKHKDIDLNYIHIDTRVAFNEYYGRISFGTPLMYATLFAKSSFAVINIIELLKSGADYTIESEEKTALSIAKERKSKIQSKLAQSGENKNANEDLANEIGICDSIINILNMMFLLDDLVVQVLLSFERQKIEHCDSISWEKAMEDNNSSSSSTNPDAGACVGFTEHFTSNMEVNGDQMMQHILQFLV